MQKQQNLVSVVIPTKNSEKFLEACLRSIKNQTHKALEILVVDGGSTDKTEKIARKYNTTFLTFRPKVPKGTFDAPHKRNYGARKAKGKFIYYLDADMELMNNVIKDAAALCAADYDAVIIPEDSFGIGIWAKAKNLERRCYWGDDTVEAPRFFKKSVWKKLDGLDESLGGGGDDWDLYQKLLQNGYRVGRISSIVRHNEGDLKLGNLIKKRFMYGRDSFKYITKRPAAGSRSYFPLRAAYFRNWRLFISRPIDAFAFLIMRIAEYSAGFSGVLYSFIKRK
jgi:glycosyltransferase involved in cell wall biosynthesis